MILHEIQAKEFDNLAKAEPNTSIFQSSHYADYQLDKGYKPLFLEYDEDNGNCVALAMFLIKKEGLLGIKSNAYCPSGYLINFYDEEILRSFNDELIKYFKTKKINKIIIEPNYSSINKYINDNLLKLNYTKVKDINRYELDIETYENTISNHGILIRINKTNELNDKLLTIFNNDQDKLKLFNCLKPYTYLYYAYIDSYKSKEGLLNEKQEHQSFINEHSDDYKFNEQILQANKQIEEIDAYLNSIEKLENAYGNDPILGLMCLSEYASNYEILFEIGLKESEEFNIYSFISDEIVKQAIENKCNVSSFNKYKLNKEINLLGTYTLKI